MKTTLRSWFLTGLLVVVAFLVGHFTADRSAPPLRSASIGQLSPSPGDDQAPFSPSEAGEREKREVLMGEQARVRMFEAANVPNQIQRLRRICELMASVTADNWRDIVDGLTRQTLSTGRLNREEWRIVLQRVGEVAGKSAIVESMESAKPQEQERVSLLLTGWASADPAAAVAWMEEQGEQTQKFLANPFIAGLARADPQAALTFLSTRMPEMRDGIMPGIIDAIIQTSGQREGDNFLRTVQTNAQIPDAVKGSIFGGFAMRQIELARMRGEPSAVLDWADPYIGTAAVGPKALSAIVSSAAAADAPATMEWVAARADRWNQLQESAVWPAVALAMQAGAPEKLNEWMNANPNHPKRDLVARTLALRQISAGEFDSAKSWAQQIGDSALRAEAENLIQKRNQPGRLPERTP
jgi:hypothetical protein